MAKALNILFIFLTACLTKANAQTVEISPPELARIPVSEVGFESGRYWQQLHVVLGQDDSPSDTALSIGMPTWMVLADTDEDGLLDDEIRIVYAPAADETPEFFVNPTTDVNTIVVGSLATAAAGGQLYLQFPVILSVIPTESQVNYGPILFADEREVDFAEGPSTVLVTSAEFNATGSMNFVALGPSLIAAGTDTTTSTLGTIYPDTEEILALVLPEIIVSALLQPLHVIH